MSLGKRYFKEKIQGSLLFSVAIGAILIAYNSQSSASNDDFKKAKKELESLGYTGVTNSGHKLFCCPDNNDFSTGFHAINSNGIRVSGCLCSSKGKGITIQFD